MNRHVPLYERLSVLQECDPVRKWHSLDEQRVWILCEKVITGRIIDIRRNDRGSYNLHCATPDCTATPRDWFYHSPSYARAALVGNDGSIRSKIPLA